MQDAVLRDQNVILPVQDVVHQVPNALHPVHPGVDFQVQDVAPQGRDVARQILDEEVLGVHLQVQHTVIPGRYCVAQRLLDAVREVQKNVDHQDRDVVRRVANRAFGAVLRGEREDLLEVKVRVEWRLPVVEGNGEDEDVAMGRYEVAKDDDDDYVLKTSVLKNENMLLIMKF